MRRNPSDPVRDAANAFDGIANVFDTLGFADAARNLRYFRSGQGPRQLFSDEEMEDHDPVLDAEDTKLTRFESRTFAGNTDDSKAFLDLEAITTIGDAALHPSTYLAVGRDEVFSTGDFKATNEGGRITIRGTVHNGFDTDSNDFDFHNGQPGARNAHILEDHQARTGEPAAAPFRFQFDRQQDVEAIARKTDDGLIIEKVTWGDIR